MNVASPPPQEAEGRRDGALLPGIAAGLDGQCDVPAISAKAAMTTELTQREMLADLAATFPALSVYLIGGWAGPEWASSGGICASCDDAVLMPDGLPIIASSPWIYQERDEFDGPMHTAFWSWLSARGWYYENYDGETFFLLPVSLIPEFELMAPTAGWMPLADGESPF